MRAFASKMEADEVDLQRTHWVGCVLGAAEGERIERATRCISVVYVVVVHGGERVGGEGTSTSTSQSSASGLSSVFNRAGSSHLPY